MAAMPSSPPCGSYEAVTDVMPNSREMWRKTGHALLAARTSVANSERVSPRRCGVIVIYSAQFCGMSEGVGSMVDFGRTIQVTITHRPGTPDERSWQTMIGGDIAYANGKRDFDAMPARVPVFYGLYPSIGHGGTYNQDNGGPFGVAAVAWLKWQLRNDADAAQFFVGTDCRLCTDAQWQTASRSLK